MSEVVLLIIGAAVTLAAQFILKLRDNSEWLKRQRMEAHADLLYELRLGSRNVANAWHAIANPMRKPHEPLPVSPENILRASARVEVLSGERTGKAAREAAEVALSAHAAKVQWIAPRGEDKIRSYLDLALRDTRGVRENWGRPKREQRKSGNDEAEPASATDSETAQDSDEGTWNEQGDTPRT